MFDSRIGVDTRLILRPAVSAAFVLVASVGWKLG